MVILSTLVVLTILGPRDQKAYKVLSNEYPAEFYDLSSPMGKEMTFNFAIMANRRYRRLELSFAILSLTQLDQSNVLVPDLRPQDPWQLLNNTVAFRDTQDLAERLGSGTEIMSGTLEMLGCEFDALVYDFTPVLRPLLESDMKTMTTIFGALRDENGTFYYYEGCPSFFFRPQDNLLLLTISHSDEELSYLPGAEEFNVSGYLPMSSAPSAGVISFNRTGRFGTFSILFSVGARRQNLPVGFGRLSPGQQPIVLIQYVRIYLDGTKAADYLNPIAVAGGQGT